MAEMHFAYNVSSQAHSVEIRNNIQVTMNSNRVCSHDVTAAILEE